MLARNLRILTGLILFAFVTCHLINLAIGLHSIEMMGQAAPYLMGLWSNPVMGPLLVVSMPVHLLLGLYALYRRNTFSMTGHDTVQTLTSLLILPLLARHIVGTMGIDNQFGVENGFAELVAYFWIAEPYQGLRQVLLLSVVWVHGALGLFAWLQLRSWWNKAAHFIRPLAVAIPVLALLGFVQAGNQAIAFAQANPQPPPPPDLVVNGTPFHEIVEFVDEVTIYMIIIYLIMVALVLLARYIRLLGKKGVAEIQMDGEEAFQTATGLSLMEILHKHDVPIANVCMGRGRCATCRVQVIAGAKRLNEIGAIEEATLKRVSAPPNVRLACQVCPGDGLLEARRLLPTHITASHVNRDPNAALLPNQTIEASE